MVESDIAADEERTVRSLAKGRSRVQRNALLRTESFKALAIVSKNAVFCAYPQETDSILINLPNGQVGEAIGVPKAPKAVFPGPSQNRHQQDETYPTDRSHAFLQA